MKNETSNKGGGDSALQSGLSEKSAFTAGSREPGEGQRPAKLKGEKTGKHTFK